MKEDVGLTDLVKVHRPGLNHAEEGAGTIRGKQDWCLLSVLQRPLCNTAGSASSLDSPEFIKLASLPLALNAFL